MTIDKALEILTDIIECGEYEGDPYDSAAVKLGIEALKFVQRYDEIKGKGYRVILPGETKE